MSPRMKSRRQTAPPTLLRLLIILYIIASFSYLLAETLTWSHFLLSPQNYVRLPFNLNQDTRVISDVQPEARSVGIVAGDILSGLNGDPYTGNAQWIAVSADEHPGDIVTVSYTRPDGSQGNADITLASQQPSHNVSPWVAYARDAVAYSFLPFLCLLIGYWVVLARPSDLNAWLLLILLTLPGALFADVNVSSGFPLLLRVLWYSLIQFAAAPALLLFGARFPERSRIDVRLPWLKWVVLVPLTLAWLVTLPVLFKEYYRAGAGTSLVHAGNLANHATNILNLACLVLFFVFILDKLRSASTADARRRLRILTAGMTIGMGSLLIVFTVLPWFGINGWHPRDIWIRYIGLLLFMLAPLSLGYVVLVQRALDVRVLVRMGTRYALARASLYILQIGLLTAIGLVLLLPGLHKREPQASDLIGAGVFLALVLALRFGVARRIQQWLDRRFFREAYNAEVMLSELSDEVRHFTETQPLLETVARRICETLHVSQIALLLRRGDAFHVEHALGLHANGGLTLPAQSSAVRYLANSSQPARLYRSDPDAWYLMAGTVERRALEQLQAELLLPLTGRNRLMGVMALGPKRSEAAWSRTDLQVLQTVARQTGLALEVSELAHSLAAEAAQRERVNREMEIAREVQERLFPQQMPNIPGASLAGSCRPALGVGGDYYDLIDLGDGRIGLAIGDVSGKGISAALLMASLRASLRGVALDNPRDFANLMHKVNRLVYEASASNRYATFFFAAYDPRSRRLDCVNAGHNPPLLLRRGQILRLDTGGPVVGLLPSAPYTEQALTLELGDLLILYTDGISEAMTHTDEEWGEDRLIAAAREVQDRTAPEILRALFAATDGFTAGAPQHDDMTLLVLKLDAVATA
jgi:phosphoserine phosphatase RsbU/P